MVMQLERADSAEQASAPRSWRWTADIYEKAARAGVFEGQRVELINGEINEMAPMNEPHAVGTNKLHRELNRRLPDSLFVRGQSPLYVGGSSVPEPDVAVVDAATVGQRPTTARLVVEVSDSTLRDDRSAKAALYASAQIAEYWILDVNARTLEVLREPTEYASGWRYAATRLLRESDDVAALCAPEAELSVRDMLP